MTLAARIVAQAAGGDVAAAGCRVAVAQLRDDLNNPDLTGVERRRRFDQVTAVTKELLARTPKENGMTDLTLFDVTIPLVRTNEDGTRETHDVTMRIPSTDEDTARDAAREIGWAIRENLPEAGDNNRHGWKIANYGVAVEVAR